MWFWNELQQFAWPGVAVMFAVLGTAHWHLRIRHRAAKKAIDRLRKERNEAQTELAGYRLGTRKQTNG